MNIWDVQHRLLTEQLDAVLYDDAGELTHEQLIRIASALHVILAQHQVNKYGYCRRCRRSSWWRFRRQPCSIQSAFAVAVRQPLDRVYAWALDQ